MTKRVYYWCGLTANQPFNTGIQRVVRCLAATLSDLGIEVIPVKWNDDTQTLAPLSPDERAHLAQWNGPNLAHYDSLPSDLSGEWLLIPEITHPVVPVGSNPARWAVGIGMKVAAIFYDMIPLKTPEYYCSGTQEWLARYWGLFGDCDLALPISETVTADLKDWLDERWVRRPQITPVLLPAEIPNEARITRLRHHQLPFIMTATGSWEPRKNYPRLIAALAQARQTSGLDIRLNIVGRKMPNEFPTLNDEIERAAHACGGVTLYDYVPDDKMSEIIKHSHATIFGSWIEGFGLPVLESIWRGLPCICHNGSSLAEIAPGGGAVMVDMLDIDAISAAIIRLASNVEYYQSVVQGAVARPLRTWRDYAKDISDAIAAAQPLPAERKAVLDFMYISSPL